MWHSWAHPRPATNRLQRVQPSGQGSGRTGGLRALSRLLYGQREVFYAEDVAPTQHHGALDDVLQLPITGIIIFQQGVPRLAREVANDLPVLGPRSRADAR
jgi:hypothetical protein